MTDYRLQGLVELLLESNNKLPLSKAKRNAKNKERTK
jgi:hypothetical protein